MKTLQLLAILALWTFTTVPAAATVTEYVQTSAWQDAAGDYTSIGFTGWPTFTLITDQYSSIGVVFPSNDCQIQWILNDPFYSDGSGLIGQTCGFYGHIPVEFDQPRYAFAVEFSSHVQIDLYMKGSLVYTSNVFDVSPFAGLVSTEPFDKVVMRKLSSSVISIDNLHFGAPIPSGPVLAFIALATQFARSRRRHG